MQGAVTAELPRHDLFLLPRLQLSNPATFSCFAYKRGCPPSPACGYRVWWSLDPPWGRDCVSAALSERRAWHTLLCTTKSSRNLLSSSLSMTQQIRHPEVLSTAGSAGGRKNKGKGEVFLLQKCLLSPWKLPAADTDLLCAVFLSPPRCYFRASANQHLPSKVCQPARLTTLGTFAGRNYSAGEQ